MCLARPQALGYLKTVLCSETSDNGLFNVFFIWRVSLARSKMSIATNRRFFSLIKILTIEILLVYVLVFFLIYIIILDPDERRLTTVRSNDTLVDTPFN